MLRVGVIGVGSMGRNHVRVYAEMEGVDLVGVADMDSRALHKITRTYRARGYSDYQAMLSEAGLDIVSVAVPTRFHLEVASEAISRGIHVLVEKPLALTTAEGEQLVALAQERGVKLSVGYVERFNPAVTEVKRRLTNGELGRVFQVHVRRLSPFPERIDDVGVVLDLATHDIDVMCYLLDSNVERVYAETQRRAHRSCEDLLSGLIRFTNGVIGVLDVNWLTPTKVRQLSVVGEGGLFLVDYLTQDVYWYKNSQVVGKWDTLGVFRDVREGDMVRVHVQKKEPLRVELESFVASVLGRDSIHVSGSDGVLALAIAERLVESGHVHTALYIDRESR